MNTTTHTEAVQRLQQAAQAAREAIKQYDDLCRNTRGPLAESPKVLESAQRRDQALTEWREAREAYYATI